MNDRNWAKIASIAPLVLSAVFVTVFFAKADAEDAVIRIAELAGLTVNLEAVPPMAKAPAVIQLRGSIEGGTPPFTYTLMFGDGHTEEGTTDTGEVVIDHKYVNSGSYMASLSAKDANGRTGTSAVAPSTSRLTGRRTDDASVDVDLTRVPVERKTARRGRETSRRRSKPIITSFDLTTPEEKEVAEVEEEPVEEEPVEEEPVEEEPVEEEPVEEEPVEEEPEAEETVAKEVPEVAVAEKKPTRHRDRRFWRRRRKAPEPEEKPEEKPEVVTEEDKQKAAAEAAAAAVAAEEREAKRREALALALEERIVALVGLQGDERPGVSRVRSGEVTEPGTAEFKKVAPSVKSRLWPKTWELDFEYEPPRRIVVSSDWRGDVGEPYWYMVYRVANSSEKPIKLSLDVELRTKKGGYSEIYNPRVLKAVQVKEKRELASFMEMAGDLESGASMEAVAVFPDVPEKTADWDFAVSGINNMYRIEGKKFRMFRKVFVISYERRGDEFQIEYDRIKYKDAVWVEEEFGRK